MVWIITTLSVLLFICIFIIYNLYKKLIVAETVTSSYFNYLDSVSRIIEFINNKVEELDKTDSFKSDDEIGFFFNEIKKLNSLLSDFTLRK
jgi:hypothetical protein|tara:strand:+ start:313 stop:585 length:273 start_codon:yes stop_codon:yes gene_type:complete